MGTIAYNRDQRIANEIVDALIGFDDQVSRRTVFRALVAGKAAHGMGDYVPARVNVILDKLVEFGAVAKTDRLEGVPMYSLVVDPSTLPRILEVARGQFQP